MVPAEKGEPATGVSSNLDRVVTILIVVTVVYALAVAGDLTKLALQWFRQARLRLPDGWEPAQLHEAWMTPGPGSANGYRARVAFLFVR